MTKVIRVAIFLLLFAISPRAQAQMAFTLSPTNSILAPGTIQSYQATLVNEGQEEVFINADRFQFNGIDLILDDAPFFANAPLSLPSGQEWTGHIFDVSASLAGTPGVYSGTFTVIGGADIFAQEDLAMQVFFVTVPAVSAAPEPDSLTLIFAVIAGTLIRMRNHSRAKLTLYAST